MNKYEKFAKDYLETQDDRVWEKMTGLDNYIWRVRINDYADQCCTRN